MFGRPAANMRLANLMLFYFLLDVDAAGVSRCTIFIVNYFSFFFAHHHHHHHYCLLRSGDLASAFGNAHEIPKDIQETVRAFWLLDNLRFSVRALPVHTQPQFLMLPFPHLPCARTLQLCCAEAA